VVFSSKKDWWMRIVIWTLIGMFGWVFYHSIQQPVDLLGIILMPLMIYLLSAIWFHTQYKLEKERLNILYVPLKKSIQIQDIHSVCHTKNPFVAPALSMNRIEINYGKYKTIQIAPNNINQFIHELQKMNPQIQMKNENV